MSAGKMVHKEPNKANKNNLPVATGGQADQWFISDLQFHKLYPQTTHHQANMHWTPLHIARKAAAFLAVSNGVNILDIGSGAGKFCLAAAHYQPNASFTGVEQRAELVNYAEAARQQAGLSNVSFVHGNITGIDFSRYDHFYFFNSFYENLDSSFRIDESISYSRELYTTYNSYLYKQLEKKPSGTRLATFHSLEDEISSGYHEVGSSEDNLLKFWIKV